MRMTQILLTLAVAAAAPALAGAQEATPEALSAPVELPPPAPVEIAAGPTLGVDAFLPANEPSAAVNVTTGTGGNEMGELASRSTEQVLDRLVNITFVNADLENALRVIARQMDLNIIMGGAVANRQITLDLRDVPLRFALDSILRSNDLGYLIEPGGIVRVVPASTIREDEIERQLLVRRLNWQIAADIQPAIEEFVTDRGTLRSDPSTNSIIVEDIPSRVTELERLLDELDSPERQVMIEARMVDVTESFARGLEANLGIGRLDRQNNDVIEQQNAVGQARTDLNNFNANQQYLTALANREPGDPFPNPPTLEAFFPAIQGNAPANTIWQGLNAAYAGIPADALAVAANVVTDPNAAWSFGTDWLGYDISLLLEAAESAGMARVLAAPRVATVNNVPALIDIQREEPYTESTFNPGGQTTQSVLFKDIGLKLEVTPRITNNGFIRMNLRPEQSILVDRIAVVGSLVPVIARRTSTTNVIVEDQRTAVLGGLRQLDAINTEEGTPWFRNLPVIGFLFRGNSYSRDLTDFYMFVTPTIIQDPNLEAAERYAHDLLDLEWNLPDDYFMDDMRIETTY
ncbi:MAG: hypothetical protein HUU25_03395 [Candidatus Sumerlaeia bacterium]|nr:hypothetical protein [Candidatus Sumerlaeia bacterium]